ncbi:hypothetical protein [Candidatus Enterovibrio altilux]|uniref:hypothetical protein n=1 Tax=Candidatus Enterovibrio altilux TaxID=1927128 RepID=UPI001CC23046|nr:hypothetical protein [Candidatus Enterovibrio luxaltus]
MYILIVITASLLYFAVFSQIIPDLFGSNNIPARFIFFSACGALGFHVYLLIDLIFPVSGQNLRILHVASFISFIIAAVTTELMSRIRMLVLSPIVYSFSAITFTAAAKIFGIFVTYFVANPQVFIHIFSVSLFYSTLMIATLFFTRLVWLDHQLKKLVMNQNLPP